jgi:enoyl-CoA hydratase
VKRLWHCPEPTVAAVRDAYLAGGCELALACDLTIAAEDAFSGEP